MSEKSPKNIKNTCKTNIYKFRANSKKTQQVNPSPFKSAQVPWTYFLLLYSKVVILITWFFLLFLTRRKTRIYLTVLTFYFLGLVVGLFLQLLPNREYSNSSCFILCLKNVGNLPTGDLHESRYETFVCVSRQQWNDKSRSILIMF